MNGYGVELVASWLTPTVLFCLLNLMIGTIFMRSKIVKPPLRNPQNGVADDTNDEQPRQLGRTPGFFERVKSFNLSRYQFDQPAEPVHHAAVVPAAQEQQDEAAHQRDPDEEKEEVHHVMRSKSHPVKKIKEAKPPAKKVLKKSVSEKMVQGKRYEEEEDEEEVDRRRPATVRERTAVPVGGEDDAAVDEKADDFISRFRQQLKLQRMDSILRFKEMLDRGTGR